MNDDRLHQLIHDARKPLNRITMQAELVKMVIAGELPQEKGLVAIEKIVQGSKECSQYLNAINEYVDTLK